MKKSLAILAHSAIAVAILGGCASDPSDELSAAEQAVSTTSSGSVTATLETTSSWSGGFCQSVTIKNTGAAVTNWSLKVATNGSSITSIWSASQTTSGTTMTVVPASYNAGIAANGSVNFGFCGSGSSQPTLTSITVTGGSAGAGGAASTGGSSTKGGSTAAGGTTTKGGSTAAGGTTTKGGSSSAGGSPTALPKFVGNITTGNGVDANGLKYSKYWNQITPENAGKWGSVQSTPSSAFNWSTLDTVYAYANTNGITFKQHTFVWGAQQPSGTPTLAQVENWIKSFCTRYPNTKIIDVVNEPPPHTTPNYTAALGSGETGSYPWIVKAFKLARKYCGSATLVLNDYNNLEYADQENNFINIANNVKANGAPIDAVGCQAHALKGMSASTLQTNINTMASKTGLPVYITEYDIGANDATQLSNFQAHFPVFMNTASVKGVTVWGWINGKTWITDSGLVNTTTPRPAMSWLMNYLGRPIPPN